MKSTSLLTHWGPVVVESDGDKITKVKGHPKDPSPSPLNESLLQTQENRVKRPAIRKSWLDNGPGSKTFLRGREEFIEVDWDEALSAVSGELIRIRDTYGHQAIYGGSYGWSSAGKFHLCSGQIRRFMRLFGSYTDAWGTYSSSAAAGIIPYVLGMPYLEAVGLQTSWSVISENTDLFISFGGLRLTNTHVHFGGQGPHETGRWLDTARRRGVHFVNISPLEDDLSQDLDPEWVRPIPGTDVALMAGLIHTLVIEERHDAEFLQNHCVGWTQLEEYILGKTDGIAKTAEWASKITGLREEKIKDLAREMSQKRTFINLTLAVQRQDHGEQSYWMGIALASALGQIGLEGGGIGFTFGASGNVGNGGIRVPVPGFPVPDRDPASTVISVSRITELLESPGEPFDFNGTKQDFPKIRLVYWAGGNIFHHHQDLNRLTKAWETLETVIMHEPFWTPAAKRADIVLPATTPLERSDITVGGNLVIVNSPAIPPLAEARDDYDIFSELSRHLGFQKDFTQGKTSSEWVRHFYETFRERDPEAPSFEEILHDGTYVYGEFAMGEARQIFLSKFRDNPAEFPLSTPSGKIELYSEKIAGYGYDDCPPHPTWLEPFERLIPGKKQRYPLHLISNQPSTRLHGQYDHGVTSQREKIKGREPCRIHPIAAKSRKIEDGDLVRLFNDRGSCLASAVITTSLMESVVELSTGAWYDPDDHGMCKHGNPNVLTRDKGTSQLAQGPTAHTCLIEIEKFSGDPPPITAYDYPQFEVRNERKKNDNPI